MAPPGFGVIHAHRSAIVGSRQVTRGGGLAVIYCTSLPTRTLKIYFQPTSFEVQFVGLQVGGILVKVVNIYRPPQLSKSTFMEEFAEMLTLISSGQNERLVCGDCNLPGADATSVDRLLSELLDEHGYAQHVTEPTRHSANGKRPTC